MLHVWAVGWKWGWAWGRDGAGGLWEMGQLISHTGPDWSEVHVMQKWPPPQVRDFLQLLFE